MQKRLTITINEEVYNGLYKVVGRGKIGRFIEDLVRPHVVEETELEQETEHELDNLEWLEALMPESDNSDVA